MCFESSETNHEAAASPETRPESPNESVRPERTQLAKDLSPLLGESQDPTLHYPTSLQDDLGNVPEESADSENASEAGSDDLHSDHHVGSNASQSTDGPLMTSR